MAARRDGGKLIGADKIAPMRAVRPSRCALLLILWFSGCRNGGLTSLPPRPTAKRHVLFTEAKLK